jgi:hypothetical protein
MDVVVADQNALDRLRKALATGSGRPRRKVELLVAEATDEMYALIGPFSNLDNLGRRMPRVISRLSRTGRREETFSPMVRRTIHWW